MIGKPWGRCVLRALGGLGALGALAAGLAACGGSSASTTTSTPAATAANLAQPIGAKSSATTASPAPKSGGAAAKGATAKGAAVKGAAPKGAVASPGAKLSVGQTAKVAYTLVGGPGRAGSSTLSVTVKSFTKGSLSDFNGIQLDASQKAGTPYYVKVHVTNLGPHTIDVDGTAAAIEGVDTTGNNQQSVTFIGTFPRCPDMASTTPLGSGHSYDDCLTFLVPGGITKVSYNGTTDYIDAPVTWSPN